MKKISHIVSCVIAICLFFALYVFLFDLACIGRISKFNHIWTGGCPFDIDGAYLNCMASYDIVSIVIILCMLCLLLFYLFKTYRKWVLLIPICGFLLFSLSVITFWGLVQSAYKCVMSMSGKCDAIYSAASLRWHCSADFSVHNRQMRSMSPGASPSAGRRAASSSRYIRS